MMITVMMVEMVVVLVVMTMAMVVMLMVVMMVLVIMVVVVMMVMVVMMPLMPGDDFIDGELLMMMIKMMVVEAHLTGARASVWQCRYTPLYFCQIILKVY